MALALAIENSDCSPGNLRTSVRLEAGHGDLDIGRGDGLHWTLPDPTRIISARHCEIRFRGGRYWLYDASINGIFLDQEVQRLHAPHPLNHGDRFAMGSYVIAVTVGSDVMLSTRGGSMRRPAAAANEMIERRWHSVA